MNDDLYKTHKIKTISEFKELGRHIKRKYGITDRQAIDELNRKLDDNGEYVESWPFPLDVAPKNEDEACAYSNTLYDSGFYPAGLDGCFAVGISGGCGKDCYVLQDGDCKNVEPSNFENFEYDEMLDLYSRGCYMDEIEDYCQQNGIELG